MRRAIRISEKTARWLLEMCERAPASNNRVSQELRAALQPKKSVIAHAKRKRVSRRTKQEETSAIYEKVAKRADGRCEDCGGLLGDIWLERPTLDHFFGRKGPQSERTCWMLRACCHNAKTDNWPDPVVWLRKFIRHCDRYGYTSEASRARRRLESLELVEQAAKVSGGGK